jgi:hypothetical protein
MDYKACALSAARSKIAYLAPDDVSKLWLDSQNINSNIMYYVFNNVVEKPIYYYDSVSSVNAYSWIQGETLHIVFRGTEGLDDVKIDLMETRAPLFPGNKTVLVHKGFLKQFRSIQGKLLDTICHSKNLVKTVHFSGHSLGAALATIASGYFSPIIRNNMCKVVCHTIGSPRIGNSGFVDWWSGLVDDSARFLNYKDPVPLLPINGYYKHINGGYEMYKNGSVKILDNDQPWYMRLLFLPFDIYYRDPTGNHACDLYIERLIKLANWNVVLNQKIDIFNLI